MVKEPFTIWPADRFVRTGRPTHCSLALPNDYRFPFSVGPVNSGTVTVMDARGKKIAVLANGEGASFEVVKPKWWQFWKQTTWRRV